ncbi:MAG: [Clostridia bacterium]|nr:[FeFe] hydrogenase H-cluster radical SAM maturase HydE [Clostridia bacterium]
RYRLTADEILACCDEGYRLGFRTFVLQGGEDPFFTDELLCELIFDIKRRHPDCAVTLSLGERSKESYQKLYAAGADRYLLRHETADKQHYELLHPNLMSYDTRMRCLHELKAIGFQVGCGFMVGSPYQTNAMLAKDLKFIEKFQPDMCGIGPFIPHECTPLASFEQGSVELTCYLLSIIRLICPKVLLPATTALGTVDPLGREKGILSGANVVMPNLSPESARSKYELYNGKLSSGAEAAENKKELSDRLEKIGYRLVISRGDVRR